MIILNVFIEVRADKEEEFLASVHDLLDPSRQEEGNILYSLFKQTDAEQKYVTIEHWQDQQAVDQHMNSEHFKSFAVQLKDYVVKPLDFKKYEA
ncbi:quinol monooxygenase YgiN [Paenibacillus shirakamiensis]|uniref:Quinol monooxygenase YgiN n=1 Tax=Paenibacillus shirakamiensis TaxID=1265935 RepID=A0ABS4JJZ7_9BACL|nr:putative quinol monooxygenase [Paenibacillus shirakamiensis]MBP2002032.1 quinol monooxygenase YgiN [Paenibacillus shirakamiensis]